MKLGHKLILAPVITAAVVLATSQGIGPGIGQRRLDGEVHLECNRRIEALRRE